MLLLYFSLFSILEKAHIGLTVKHTQTHPINYNVHVHLHTVQDRHCGSSHTLGSSLLRKQMWPIAYMSKAQLWLVDAIKCVLAFFHLKEKESDRKERLQYI